jgi:pimeloyl-ACP methyl ester carboxylesterase
LGSGSGNAAASREVGFPARDGTQIAGTLVVTDPAGPGPAALIVNGSGPLDRDSNMRGQRLDVASAIAAALAARGIASLRFDKRGVGASEGDFLRTDFQTETSDAGAALAWLRDRPEIDASRVALIGHSVGATVAVRLASSGEAVAGAVLLAAAARPGEEVMRRQSDRIAASLTGVQRVGAGWFLRRQERARRVLLESRDDIVRMGLRRFPARWFREYMRYDPAGDLAAIGCPVLAITGSNDIQVDPGDVDRIGELVPGPFTGLEPAGLTHVLRTHARAGISSYSAQLKGPVDAGLLVTIGAWLTEKLSGQ